MADRKVAAIVVAAGRGTRAGTSTDGPKQYQKIGGEAVLTHTLRAFSASGLVDAIVVVIHPDDRSLYAKAILGLAFDFIPVAGAASRQGSVRAGLEALAGVDPEIVLIHDGARPFIEAATIRRVIEAAGAGVGALPAVPVADTLKRADGDGTVLATVERAGLFSAQTPQGFSYAAIRAAHAAAAVSGLADFTDDASLAEWAGMTVRLVEGSPRNVKLTQPEDIATADLMLERRLDMIDVRTGNGYDVHQLLPGDRVTLCGVAIPHDQALSGHSDADVGLHALTDALLATCGAGDIGDHFPPSDPRWRGAASHLFVRHAVELVARHGGRIANADVTLIAEAPKIAPHRQAMREAIAEMTGLAIERVSVKATTNETIGFVGRREGIAALATASVVYGKGP